MDKTTWVIKSIAALICLILFVINNYVLFLQFAERQTVASTNVEWKPTEMFPNIIICNSSAYKNYRMSSIDMKSYLNNTFEISEALISIDLGNENNEIGSSDHDATLWNSSYISNDVILDSVITYYRGHCYKFKYKLPVHIINLDYPVYLNFIR